MESLDRNMQRRVWARVYGQGSPRALLTRQQQELLRRCLERTQENLAVYEKMTNHSVYGEAFTRLATESGEHIKMLREILRR